MTQRTDGPTSAPYRSRGAARRGRLAANLAALGILLAGCSGEFAGATFGEAVEVIESRGQTAEVMWDATDEAAPGTVIESVVRPDGSVALRVSSRGRVPVPDLVGVDADEAERTLTELGLGIRRTNDPAREGPFGVVTSSEPSRDVLLAPESDVTLRIRESERNTITGTLVLAADKDQLGAESLPTDGGPDSDDWMARGPSFAGERCWGRGFYSDIVDGAPFVVRDSAGMIVAKGELGRGTAVYVGDRDATLAADTDWDCHFRYRIEDVPFSAFYAIETVRNTLTYAFEDLEVRSWRVDLTIPIDGPPDLR
jgi:hypothetical protein